MIRKFRIVSALFALTFIAPGCNALADKHAVKPMEPHDVEVVIDNFTFSPAKLEIAPGTRVTWINHDDVPHTATSTKKVFASKALDTDDKFSFVFTTPGSFPYFCAVHPHMTGEVIVK